MKDKTFIRILFLWFFVMVYLIFTAGCVRRIVKTETRIDTVQTVRIDSIPKLLPASKAEGDLSIDSLLSARDSTAFRWYDSTQRAFVEMIKRNNRLYLSGGTKADTVYLPSKTITNDIHHHTKDIEIKEVKFIPPWLIIIFGLCVLSLVAALLVVIFKKL